MLRFIVIQRLTILFSIVDHHEPLVCVSNAHLLIYSRSADKKRYNNNKTRSQHQDPRRFLERRMRPLSWPVTSNHDGKHPPSTRARAKDIIVYTRIFTLFLHKYHFIDTLFHCFLFEGYASYTLTTHAHTRQHRVTNVRKKTVGHTHTHNPPIIR